MQKEKKSAKVVVLPHTQAKLDLYSSYLERYLAVLANVDFLLNIYDVFCGAGIYEDGKEGSPLIAYKIIRGTQERLRSSNLPEKKISLTINDGKPELVKRVELILNAQNEEHSFCTLRYFSLPASDFFIKVQAELSMQSHNSRNLLFIDPYGYKEIRKDNLTALMDNHRTEIVLFLPISPMYRFKDASIRDQDNPAYYSLRTFMCEFFSESHPVFHEDVDVFRFIEYIKEALSFNDKYFTAAHYIQRDASNYYALFFLTSNVRGLEKVVEAIWKMDEYAGQGFKLQPQQLNIFAAYDAEHQKSMRVEFLKQKILDALKVGINNKDLYLSILRWGFLPKHGNTILHELHEEGCLVLEPNPLCTVRKGTFYLSYDRYNEPEYKLIMRTK